MYPSLINNGCYNENNHSKNPHQDSFYNTTPSSSSFLLPSPIYIPLEDEAVFCEFFQQQQFISNDHHHNHHHMINTIDIPNYMESTMEECSNNINGHKVATKDEDDHVETENSSPIKKPNCKRDRHSKINTARGPRDRRMRLSLDVAKKFFGLQDLLGFDKASKTVDWLLDKSKTAIQELLPDRSCSVSSTSECEVQSDHQSLVKTGEEDQAITAKNKEKSCCGSSKKQKEKVTRVRKCVDFHHPLAKATRERARERARERTIEKRNNKHSGGDVHDSKFKPCVDQAMNQLRSWSTFQETNVQVNQGFVGDNSSLLMTNNWTPSYFLCYQHSSGVIHEHQLINENVKAWEGNNN